MRFEVDPPSPFMKTVNRSIMSFTDPDMLKSLAAAAATANSATTLASPSRPIFKPSVRPVLCYGIVQLQKPDDFVAFSQSDSRCWQ